MDKKAKAGYVAKYYARQSAEHGEGVQAFLDGKYTQANPYEPFTPEWADWRRGFIDATNASIDFGVGGA